MEKIKTLTGRDLKPVRNYALHCARFLEHAKPLDALIIERNLQAATLSTMLHAPTSVKATVSKASIAHVLNVAAGIRYPLKNLGLSFASVLLPQSVTSALRESALIKQADARAKFLIPQLGEQTVAMLLPPELRTEDAAAYMRKRKHDALQTVITASLNEALTHCSLALK